MAGYPPAAIQNQRDSRMPPSGALPPVLAAAPGDSSPAPD